MKLYIFQCQLSFYVFDWDGTNTINDDFLGSAMHAMSEVSRPSSFVTIYIYIVII
jgi:hypothetical protein